MLNYILSYLTLCVFFVLQTTVSHYTDVFGIAPNLVFVFALCYSMYNFPVRSAILCVIAGIITDMYTMQYVGLNALLIMYMGLAISIFASTLIRKNIFAVAVVVLLSSMLYHSVILIINYVIPSYSGFSYPFARFVLPTALYDSVLSVVVSVWARSLSRERIKGL